MKVAEKVNGSDTPCAEGTTRKNIGRQSSDSECIYKRVGKPSVAFCERGAAAERLKKGRNFATFLIAA